MDIMKDGVQRPATPEEEAAILAQQAIDAATSAPIPNLAPWQFRAMLKLSGKEADLLAFLDALPEPQQTVAKAQFEYTLVFHRDNSLVLAAQQALGLTDEQLDALWTQAAAL